MCRSLLRGTLAAGLGILLVLTLPGIADASVVGLDANTARLASGAGTYTITTGGPYWSVVGVRPPLDQDYDLQLSRDGVQLAKSELTTGHFDFIAIDSNLMPGGASYEATVSPYGGATGQYSVNFADPLTVMNHSSGVMRTPEPQFITIRDVYLDAGQNYGFYGGLAPYVYLMASDPANQWTWMPNRVQAAAYVTFDGNQACAKYQAPRSGWYGLVAVDWFDDGRKNGAQRTVLEPINTDNAERFSSCRQF